MPKSAFLPSLLIGATLAASASGIILPPAWSQAAKLPAKPVAKGTAKPAAAPGENAADADGFAGLLAIVNKNPNDAAQLDHVRLLSTDKELNERVDINVIHSYIVTSCAAISNFFNSAKHGKPIGLSVNCDLLPGGHALYQLEIRPRDREDPKLGVALTQALEKIKVPAVSGPVSLQILMKVWFPKAEAAAFFKKGFELQKAAKYKEAIQQYTEDVTVDPSHTEAYTLRGICYNALEQYDKAIADLTKSISLGGHDAFLNRAYAYRHMNDADNAMADCNRAIELEPDYWEGYVSRAELWNDKGNFTEAMKDANKVLELKSSCGYGYLQRGEAHLGLKETEDAVRDFNQAIEMLAISGEAFHYRALAYKILGKEEEAASDENRAKELGYIPKK